MPNGSDLTREEFETLERPLRLLDRTIDEFARQKSAQVNRNYHATPNRHLEWLDDGLTRSILISPVCRRLSPTGGYVRRPTVYVFNIVVHRDYTHSEWPVPIVPPAPPMRRKWWHATIVELEELPADECEFKQLLENAFTMVSAIREDQLIPA
jgi:hypothetical protein